MYQNRRRANLVESLMTLCPPKFSRKIRPFEMVQVGPHLDRCVWSKKRATLTMLRRNYYEKAFALRNGNNLFCCPGAYCTRAIGLRWFLGYRLRNATRRMRSYLQ